MFVFIYSLLIIMILQYDKAFKHAYAAEEGGSYGASIKILQMKVELKQDFEIDKMFENIFQKHPEIMYKIQTCMNAITYFTFKKRNIFRALNYFFKAANMEAKLEDFVSFLLLLFFLKIIIFLHISFLYLCD